MQRGESDVAKILRLTHLMNNNPFYEIKDGCKRYSKYFVEVSSKTLNITHK